MGKLAVDTRVNHTRAKFSVDLTTGYPAWAEAIITSTPDQSADWT